YVYHSSASPTTVLYPLSLHDALPICPVPEARGQALQRSLESRGERPVQTSGLGRPGARALIRARDVRLRAERQRHAFLLFQRIRSEEHTSELQSRFDLVCRLLLEKKK